MELLSSLAGVLIGAAISLATLVLSSRLTERREWRKVIFEREHLRLAELQEVAGTLVEDLMRLQIRTDEEKTSAFEKLKFIRTASGRFLRYRSVASALRDLENSAGWYIREDMRHETKEEFEKARADVESSFKSLSRACNDALKDPNGL